MPAFLLLSPGLGHTAHSFLPTDVPCPLARLQAQLSIDPTNSKRPLLEVCAQSAPSIAVACWLRYWVENMHAGGQQTVDTSPGGGTLGVDDPCGMVEVRPKAA
jgi:hypothetical protein